MYFFFLDHELVNIQKVRYNMDEFERPGAQALQWRRKQVNHTAQSGPVGKTLPGLDRKIQVDRGSAPFRLPDRHGARQESYED